MTREQLLTKLANARAGKINLTWPQFTSAVVALSAQQKETLLTLVNNNSAAAQARVGELLGKIVFEKKQEIARAEVDAIAADDTYTTDELLNLLS